MKIGAVLMASGAGSRFGSNKLLHPVEGVPMIQRALNALPVGLFTAANVVSCYPEILALAAEKGYQAIDNPHAAEGQSASIRLGLEPLTAMDGVLFTVCDQPWLTTASVEKLLETFAAHPQNICVMSWQGRWGNPAIFPAALYLELLALTGEQRGGIVIKAHPERLRLVEAGSPRELEDIDFQKDLK